MLVVLKPGTKLANGAILITHRKRDDHEGVVLAIQEDSGDAYITWRIDLRTGDTYWGHYFNARSFDLAYKDYLER